MKKLYFLSQEFIWWMASFLLFSVLILLQCHLLHMPPNQFLTLSSNTWTLPNYWIERSYWGLTLNLVWKVNWVCSGKRHLFYKCHQIILFFHNINISANVRCSMWSWLKSQKGRACHTKLHCFTVTLLLTVVGFFLYRQ